MSNAHVIVHWDPSGSKYLKDNLGIKQDIASTTDSSGHFSLDLPPGFYDVFVTALRANISETSLVPLINEQ